MPINDIRASVMRAGLLVAFTLFTTVSSTVALAQERSPDAGPISGNVTMTLFKIIEQKGKKYLETPTGETVPIAGKHLAKDASLVAVYRDSQNNYWFINKDGQPTAIPPQKVQWAVSEISEQRLAKEQTQAALAAQAAGSSQYPTGQAPVQQTTIIQGPGNAGGSGSGASMVGTGLAAAGGAMLGGLIGDAMYDGNHYYGIPYGTPMYRGGAAPFYADNSGNRVYVNNSHITPINDQWAHQGEWNNRDQWTRAAASEGARNDFTGRRFHEGWGGFRGRR